MKVRIILIALSVAVITGWFLVRGRAGGGRAPDAEESGGFPRPAPRVHRVREVKQDAAKLPPLEALTQDQWADPDLAGDVAAALVELAQRDRSAALAWLNKAPEATRDKLREDFACAFVAVDPSFVMEVLSDSLDVGKSAEIIRQAAMEFANQHPDEAIGWAQSQPDEEARALVLGAVLSDLSQTKGSEAAGQLDLLPLGHVRDRTTVEVIQRWAQQDVTAASAYVLGLRGAVAVDSVSSLVSIWATSDRGAAEKWVGSLAPGDLRQAGEAALAGVPKGEMKRKP